MTLIFCSVFEQDFVELIARFASEGSVEVANRFEKNTCDLIALLLRNPELGRVRKELKPVGIRSFRVKGFHRYLLFYQVRDDHLILLRLRYGGMNLERLLFRSE